MQKQAVVMLLQRGMLQMQRVQIVSHQGVKPLQQGQELLQQVRKLLRLITQLLMVIKQKQRRGGLLLSVMKPKRLSRMLQLLVIQRMPGLKMPRQWGHTVVLR